MVTPVTTSHSLALQTCLLQYLENRTNRTMGGEETSRFLLGSAPDRRTKCTRPKGLQKYISFMRSLYKFWKETQRCEATGTSYDSGFPRTHHQIRLGGKNSTPCTLAFSWEEQRTVVRRPDQDTVLAFAIASWRELVCRLTANLEVYTYATIGIFRQGRKGGEKKTVEGSLLISLLRAV